MNILAKELNDRLSGSVAGKLLSRMGAELYFPRGIIAQTAEAKQHGKKFNATIGIAMADGKPLILPEVQKQLPFLAPGEAVAYAPTAGLPALRKLWKDSLYRKNPSLEGAEISLPVVVPGLTAGLSLAIDLFCDPIDSVVVANPCWDNYPLIIETRKSANLSSYPAFTHEGAYNVAGLENAVRTSPNGRAIVLLNFPNNPTGYSPTIEEAEAIVSALVRIAETGKPIFVIVDDAYFGLFYENGTYAESLFSRFATAHKNILTLKLDGSTKEDFVWGFRTAFATFGGSGMTADSYDALETKLVGAIRSSVSCCSTPAQSIMLKVVEEGSYEADKASLKATLAERYARVRNFVSKNPPPERLKTLPFNSGYFMSFECLGISAEALRVKLLMERGIGTVALQDKYLRVAYSSVDAAGLEELYAEIYAAAREL